MTDVHRRLRTRHALVIAGLIVACSLTPPVTAWAQEALGSDASALDDAAAKKKKKNKPLVLKAQGSFFVNGDNVMKDEVSAGSLWGPGHITVNQMYVRYMIPQKPKIPVVMVHGGTLSGKSWETTPDGRMGWDEYFVRKGHAVYVPEQVSRARSGFDQSVFNQVRAGIVPPTSLPLIIRFPDEAAWNIFRFGETPGVPYTDAQFPVEAAAEFSKQGIPDLNLGVPDPNPSYKALADLANQLNGAVVIGHSESGNFPLEAALVDPTGLRGLIVTEPASVAGPGCTNALYSDKQIAKLAKIPILVFFGDHLDQINPIVNWRAAFNDCKAFIARINAAHGNATMLYPPELGIRGNSHMFMLDKNNQQIADLFLKWIKKNVKPKK